MSQPLMPVPGAKSYDLRQLLHRRVHAFSRRVHAVAVEGWQKSPRLGERLAGALTRAAERCQESPHIAGKSTQWLPVTANRGPAYSSALPLLLASGYRAPSDNRTFAQA